MEPEGIEPSISDCKSDVFPLNYGPILEARDRIELSHERFAVTCITNFAIVPIYLGWILRIELRYQVPQTCVLPLNYTHKNILINNIFFWVFFGRRRLTRTATPDPKSGMLTNYTTSPNNFGGSEWNCTTDTQIFSLLLYYLSYRAN